MSGILVRGTLSGFSRIAESDDDVYEVRASYGNTYHVVVSPGNVKGPEPEIGDRVEVQGQASCSDGRIVIWAESLKKAMPVQKHFPSIFR